MRARLFDAMVRAAANSRPPTRSLIVEVFERRERKHQRGERDYHHLDHDPTQIVSLTISAIRSARPIIKDAAVIRVPFCGCRRRLHRRCRGAQSPSAEARGSRVEPAGGNHRLAGDASIIDWRVMQ